MRVTNQAAAAAVQRSLQANYATMARLQEQGASGRRITRASDDPAGTAETMNLRGQLAAQKQYERNVGDASGWLATLDSALGQVTDVLQRARDLAVQGFSQTTSADARKGIAVELEALREELLSQAGTTYMGRTVFAGTSDEAGVFEPGTYTYTGVDGSSVERRVGPDSTVQVDLDGRAVFGEGDESVFALLDRMVSDMHTGEPHNFHIDDVDDALSRVLTSHTTVGSRQKQVDRAGEAIATAEVNLDARRSGVEDTDMAELLIDLQVAENAYQAALGVGARILQPTLLDFIS